jgi:hypothetical protein
VEADASLGMAWLEYADLWAGDPILGGFDLASPSEPLDRWLLVPRASVTWRPGVSHRFRLRVDGRSLARVPTLDDDLAIVHVLVSDGVPVSEAWRERLFLDEASWRWRPGGDPASDLRVGVLPYGIVGGRFQAESWPGLRYRLDARRLGWAPLAVELRAASTLRGTEQAALALRHEPSMFEHLALELAWTRDSSVGVAPLLEQDLGMLTELWAATSGDFIDSYQGYVLDGLNALYGSQADGMRAFHSDLQQFMGLEGRADLIYASAFARVLAGPVLLDAAVVHSRGRGELRGWAFADDTLPEQVGVSWYEDAPREAWAEDFEVRGWAWDFAASVLADGRWQPGVFFQGMTGEDDLVARAAAGLPVRMFIASDPAFVRTRVFPADSAARSGALDFPPGVAGHGLLTPGAWLAWDGEHIGTNLQLALPCATRPSPLEPHLRIYGLEADLLVAASPWDSVQVQLEGGLFQPGTFFIDSSDPAGDHPFELPLGWRIIGAVTIHGQSG